MINYVENVKNAREFNTLIEGIGWTVSEEYFVQEALENTIFSISAYDYGNIVGYGRLIGDGTLCIHIQDIMVLPEYQGRRIGTTIILKLLEKVKELQKTNPNIVVCVGAELNKEGFYRQFGFKTRQEVHKGASMILQPMAYESKLYNWEEKIKQKELQKVIDVLDNDGIVIFPTDTVYGIGCNCFSEKAVAKLYEIKNRASYKPINVLTDSVEKMEQVTEKMTPKEKELINKYMPGALTLILKKNDEVPNKLTAGLDTIGVRIPDNEIALKILSSVAYPLATTSANISGKKDGIKVEDFINDFDGKVDIIVDGGITDLKQSSTIVEVTDNNIAVIRQGTVEIEEN